MNLDLVAGKLHIFFDQQRYVDVPPHKLFDGGGDGDTKMHVGRPDKVFFVASHASDDVVVRPMDVDEVASRMVFSLEEERMPFMSYYYKFRFAFPDRANELIDRAEHLQRVRLRQALADKEAYEVYHPYPVSLPALYEAISPLLQ